VAVDGVGKTFGAVHALRDVSFSVAPGEFLTVSGPSGSGKSTLLSLIGSLDEPDAGRILVDDRPVPAPRNAVEFRRRTVGFVFQDNLLMPYLSAQLNVETALLAVGVGRQQRAERARTLLEEVGLGARAEHLPSQLSGGERQRVAIARALANEPRLLLADEPTGALEAEDSARVLDLLMQTRERHGMTLMVVTHDVGVTERADRVVRLVAGAVV
jgi:putative ABC transport system ATP-binding protein